MQDRKYYKVSTATNPLVFTLQLPSTHPLVTMIQSNKPGKIAKHHAALTSTAFCTPLQQTSYDLCMFCVPSAGKVMF